MGLPQVIISPITGGPISPHLSTGFFGAHVTPQVQGLNWILGIGQSYGQYAGGSTSYKASAASRFFTLLLFPTKTPRSTVSLIAGMKGFSPPKLATFERRTSFWVSSRPILGHENFQIFKHLRQLPQQNAHSPARAC